MKALILIVSGLFSASTVFSQFYYNDVIVTGESSKRRNLLVQQQVKQVKFLSIDGTGQPVEGFTSEQVVSGNGTTLTTTTNTVLTGETRTISSFDAYGRLVKSVDTTDGSKTSVEYFYNPAGKISRLISRSVSAGDFSMEEQHIWTWNASGKPEKMLKIKNGRDTTYVNFVTDEQGDIVEEKAVFRNQPLPTYFYYYDQQHRITDIVRYNEKAQRLLPDYVFEYNDSGKLSSMMVVSDGTGDYQKWIYTYDEKGLKLKDECFSKAKALIGKIEYQYKK